nr:MAG TPA: hypothetical protein [Caudoviricetes sp.]
MTNARYRRGRPTAMGLPFSLSTGALTWFE